VQAGEEILVTRADVPVARIMPAEPQKALLFELALSAAILIRLLPPTLIPRSSAT
jgi:antitoxin (DNA-binding transcriptional repressor) of toxin-antitoxin stability system